MSRRSILLFLARLLAFAAVAEAVTSWIFWRSEWTPLERHYLSAYIWCSLPVAPATVEVRLIWKAGRHRKQQLAADTDIDFEDGTSMALSQSARHAGWKTLTEDPPQQVSTAKLAPALADLAFDGETLWDFLLFPEACAVAVFLFAFLGWFCLRGLCLAFLAEFAWRRGVHTWQKLPPLLFDECVALADSVRSDLEALHRSAARRIEMHRARPRTEVVMIQPAAKPASFALSLFGVYNGSGEGYFWSEKDEIE